MWHVVIEDDPYSYRLFKCCHQCIKKSYNRFNTYTQKFHDGVADLLVDRLTLPGRPQRRRIISSLSAKPQLESSLKKLDLFRQLLT